MSYVNGAQWLEAASELPGSFKYSVLSLSQELQNLTKKSLDFVVQRKSRAKEDIELVNLMKKSEDHLLFYCGGSQKPSQRAVWVHVRVSSFTAEVQT